VKSGVVALLLLLGLVPVHADPEVECHLGSFSGNCSEIGPTPNAEDKQVIVKMGPGDLVYEPQFMYCLQCVFPRRQIGLGFAIQIAKGDGSFNTDTTLSSMAVRAVIASFGHAAPGILRPYTDTTPNGWTDDSTSVCRAHQKKATLVLGRPYFEDAQYCLRLLKSDAVDHEGIGLRAMNGDPISSFRIQGEVVAAVTLNPSSPYREPDSREIVPFEEILVQVVSLTKIEMASELVRAGWILDTSTQGVDFRISGLRKSVVK